MKTWPGGLLICLLGGLPARFSSASGRGEFINVTNHRRSSIHQLCSDWSIKRCPLSTPELWHVDELFCFTERARKKEKNTINLGDLVPGQRKQTAWSNFQICQSNRIVHLFKYEIVKSEGYILGIKYSLNFSLKF